MTLITMSNILQEDLDHILAHTEGLWEEFRGQRIFMTGGTGFFGGWLLESLLTANDAFLLNVEVTVLTRHPDVFAEKSPHLAFHPAIRLHRGDVRDFIFPDGCFSHVLHAATDASAKMNAETPLLMLDTIVEGTRRVLDFAVQSGAKKVLYTSSGAVYGRQPPQLLHIPEDYQGAPDPLDPGSAYGEGKRAAELLCALYAKQFGLESKIARCFAFVGPGMPMGAHFAIGNFIQDALNGETIKVKGDGTPLRSYLYAADLAIWLWTILLRGNAGTAYNVGSGRAFSIGEIAAIVADCAQAGPVMIQSKANLKSPSERYIPDVTRAKVDLGLTVRVDLEEAIRRTLQHHVSSRQ
ncbi:MAG: NAD-dependent epimerase/dehydratase family protein [bacterium]